MKTKITIILSIIMMFFSSCKEEDSSFLTVDETPITATAEAGIYSIAVSSNGEWTAVVENTANNEWCTLTNASGTNNGTVIINVAENTTPTPRSAIVKITLGSLTKSVVINQAVVTYEIYENHDISACGVNDPLQNIDWLKKYCESLKERQDILSVSIDLYKVIGKEHVFKINIAFLLSPDEWGDMIDIYGNIGYLEEWRNCTGEIIFRVPYPGTPPPPNVVEDFMEDKKYVAELFHFVKQ